MTSIVHRLFPRESGMRAVMSAIAAGVGAVSAILAIVLVIMSR